MRVSCGNGLSQACQWVPGPGADSRDRLCGAGACVGLQLIQNHLSGYGYGLLCLGGRAHANGLFWVDGDGVEDDLVAAAMDVEDVEQVFHADIVGSERGGVIARETRGGAGDCADGVAVVRGIDEDNAVGGLERLKQREAACAAVEAFHIGRKGELFELPHDVYTDAFIAHEDVAQAEHQRLQFRTFCHFSPGRTSIHQ